MGVSLRVVDWLRINGHDAVHLRDENLQCLPDADIFLKAAAENRIVLTFDLDFGEILALSGDKLVSVVLFRLHNTATLHVIERLSRVLLESSPALEDGAIIVAEDLRHRVRRLPLAPEQISVLSSSPVPRKT